MSISIEDVKVDIKQLYLSHQNITDSEIEDLIEDIHGIQYSYLVKSVLDEDFGYDREG